MNDKGSLLIEKSCKTYENILKSSKLKKPSSETDWHLCLPDFDPRALCLTPFL